MSGTHWEGEVCPACGGPLRFVGFFLGLRQEDQKRVCRVPLHCVACDRTWSRWADRDEPLQEDPVPLPAALRPRS